MAGENNKNIKQKTISFRLNMERDEERALFEEIQRHSGGMADERYGSSGAYIKKVLLENLENEIVCREQRNIQETLERLKETFLEAQEAMILRMWKEQPAVNCGTSQRVEKVSVATSSIGSAVEEGELPEEAFSYLSSL